MDHETTREKSVYPNKQIDLSPDPNTNTLISKILDRDKEGMDKFGLTMRQVMLKNPIDCKRWLNNSLEEKNILDEYNFGIRLVGSFLFLIVSRLQASYELPGLKMYCYLLLF